MTRSSKLAALTFLVCSALLVGGCGGPTVTASPRPTGATAASGDIAGGGSQAPIASDEPASAAPSDEPASPNPTEAPASIEPTSSPTASPSSGETMIVRAYFLLDESEGNPTLVPVLRTVPKTTATARAALRALLAGPTSRERGAARAIETSIPAGTRLLGVSAAGGAATVDLSSEFASAGTSFTSRARLSQVVYTLTQFSSIHSVRFEIDGVPLTTLPPALNLEKPLSRASYRGSVLPDIFVDRPAWGAALLNGGRVNGIANVFEAQFRLAVLDARGKVLVDLPVHASCGTGCWGTFDLTVHYTVSKGQYGILRVWDPSEDDGHPTSVREYPVWLAP